MSEVWIIIIWWVIFCLGYFCGHERGFNKGLNKAERLRELAEKARTYGKSDGSSNS